MLISVSKNDLEFLMEALVNEITMLREDDPFVIKSRKLLDKLDEKINKEEENKKKKDAQDKRFVK